MKWDLGFAEARVKQIEDWSRLFALFVIALMALTALGMQLLVQWSAQAQELLRRVTSRRRHRGELSLIAAVIALIQKKIKVCLQNYRPTRNLSLTMFYESGPTSAYPPTFSPHLEDKAKAGFISIYIRQRNASRSIIGSIPRHI